VKVVKYIRVIGTKVDHRPVKITIYLHELSIYNFSFLLTSNLKLAPMVFFVSSD
jgi:hypothetical protein